MKKMKLFMISLLSIVSLACFGAVGCKDNGGDSSSPDSSDSSVGTTVEYGIQFTEKSATLEIFDVKQLNVTTENVTETIQFTSSNPAVATVDASGIVKALTAGNTVITAKANGVSANCTITVTDSGYVPTLELNTEKLTLNDDPFVLQAKVKFNGQYMEEGVEISWSVASGDSVTVTPIANSLKAKLEVASEGYESTVILVTATFNGVEMNQYVTVGTSNGLVLGFTSDVDFVDNKYLISADVIDGEGALSTIDLSEMLTVETSNGTPLTEYQAEYSVENENVASVANGIVTATGIGSTEVYVNVSGYEIAVNVSFNYVEKDRTSTTLSLELFDRAAYAQSGTYQYVSAYDLTSDFGAIQGNVKKVTLDGNEVFSGNQEMSSTGESTITLNLSGASFDAQYIELKTDYVSYKYSAKVYTQILKTTADVQNWLDVAIGLKPLTDGKIAGHFILGNNITSETSWNYTPKAASDSGNFTFNTYAGFEGTFDGNGYYIDKMNIAVDAEHNMRIGFIPVIAANGTLKNVAFTNATMTLTSSLEWSGFLTANLAGAIKDVYVDVDLIAGEGAGDWNYSGIIAAGRVNATETVERVVIDVNPGSVKLGSWGTTYVSFAFYNNADPGANVTMKNVFIVTSAGTNFWGMPESTCSQFASASAMADAADTYDYATNFTAPVWTVVENLPKFATTAT